MVEAEENRPPLTWLTVELSLYGLILCLALALRLGGLGIRIMDASEAGHAWQAWQLTRGHAPTGSYSPLLLSGQALLFALFGSSDVVARLLPALVGSILVVVPYFGRPYLGRYGALASALALALSPTLVYISRYGSGAALLLTCALGSIVLWWAYRRERRPAYLAAIAVMAALALIADPRVIGVLIAYGLAWALQRQLFARNQSAAETPPPIPWRRFGTILGATLIPTASALAFNPGGLGAWADFASSWGRHFAPVVNGQPWYYPLLALLMYEPFPLLFGIIGAASLLTRKQVPAVLLWMTGGLLIVALLAGGRDPGDVALVCAPLALLAGRAVEDLVCGWQTRARVPRESLFVLIVLGVVVYVAFEASFYARSLYRNLPQSAQFLWFWLLAMSLVVVMSGLSIAWFGLRLTWRVGGAVLAIVLLLIAFSAAVGLNYRHVNDPRELHILTTSDPGVRDALQVMEDLSYHKRGDPHAAALTAQADLGPLWRWYLREWEDVTFAQELTASTRTPLVLTSAQGDLPALGQDYIGQDFVARTWWQPSQLSYSDNLTWWFYRQSVSQPIPIEKVILWMQVEEVASNE